MKHIIRLSFSFVTNLVIAFLIVAMAFVSMVMGAVLVKWNLYSDPVQVSGALIAVFMLWWIFGAFIYFDR
jgi:hypothetical protein